MSFPSSFHRLGRFRLALLASATAALAFACGGISDPTKGSAGGEKVATISGALTGTSVPANARVALVWRTKTASAENGGYAVGDDVAVVAGRFTMSLAVPEDTYFSTVEGQGFSNDAPQTGSTRTPASASTGGTGGGAGSDSKPPVPAPLPAGGRVTPRDNVSGGLVTSPLSGAIAGFVVYADSNGNGKLDLAGPYAASTDEILGGNTELILAYLKDGGALDYEKMRDTSGIAPSKGFNLAWTKGRWLPLDVVELKLDPKQGLPSPVCSSGGALVSGTDPVVTAVKPPSTSTGGGTPNAWGNQNVTCSPDGRSFTYSTECPTPPPAPAPVGLCAGLASTDTVGCATLRQVQSLADGEAVPEGWPCTVTGSSGVPDAGSP